MRVVSCEVDWDMGGRKLCAYEEYVVEDQSLTQISGLVRGACEAKKYKAFVDADLDPMFLKDKKILLLRAGAAGDLLFMKPTVDKLVEIGADVTLTTMPTLKWVHRGTNTSWTEWPVYNYWDEYDYVFDLEYINSEVQGKHPIDEFARLLNVKLTEDERIPKWKPDEEVLQKMQELYPKKEGKKRIVICAASTTLLRDYPFDQFNKVAHELYKKGHDICFVGHPKSIDIHSQIMREKILNLTQSDLSWEEQVVFIKTADCFIGGDSGNTHFAGAMNVPTVALYGSFHWKDRSSVFKSVKSLQGNGDCACCYFHPSFFNDWPKGKPCEKSNRCEVLASIPVERVVSEVEKIL